MGRRIDFLVRPGSRPRLKHYDTTFTGGFADEGAAVEKIEADCGELASLQDRLMAEETHALLVILQAVDGSGKDGTIKHVASSLDPQGCTRSLQEAVRDREQARLPVALPPSSPGARADHLLQPLLL